MICPFLFIPVGLILLGTFGEIVVQVIHDYRDTHPDIGHLNFGRHDHLKGRSFY
jgi:hypothetical protein